MSHLQSGSIGPQVVRRRSAWFVLVFFVRDAPQSLRPSIRASNANQEEFNRSISSSTISMEIRPLRASVAMRTTTAFKSLKLRIQRAEGQVRVELADLAQDLLL